MFSQNGNVPKSNGELTYASKSTIVSLAKDITKRLFPDTDFFINDKDASTEIEPSTTKSDSKSLGLLLEQQMQGSISSMFKENIEEDIVSKLQKEIKNRKSIEEEYSQNLAMQLFENISDNDDPDYSPAAGLDMLLAQQATIDLLSNSIQKSKNLNHDQLKNKPENETLTQNSFAVLQNEIESDSQDENDTDMEQEPATDTTAKEKYHHLSCSIPKKTSRTSRRP
ncbi:hypothetical protein CBL_05061 [Carabus blaptoides fortunei]